MCDSANTNNILKHDPATPLVVSEKADRGRFVALVWMFFFAATNSVLAQSVTANGTTNPIIIASGSNVSIHAVRNGAPNRYDMVRLYVVGSLNSQSLQTWYMNGTATAPPAPGIDEATFNVVIIRSPGNYEFRYFANGNTSQLLATSAVMTIKPPVVTVEGVTAPNIVTAMPEETVSVAFTGGTGASRFDWMGMFRVGDMGDTTGAALEWFYLNGSKSAPATPLISGSFDMSLPIGRGDYEFRYYKSTTTRLSDSPRVIATSPMTPRERFGVVSFDWAGYRPLRIDQLGVGTVRGSCDWAAMQTAQGGTINWSCTDAVIYGAAGQGLRVLMTITCTPAWANATSTTDDRICEVKMPTATSDWASFVSAFVDRYSSYDVVLGVYNEPNLRKGAVDAMGYVYYCALFQAAAAVRGSSNIRLAGPETSWHGSKPSENYFADAVNCMLPNMRADDIFTLHYYADATFTVTAQMQAATQIAEGHELWLSEVGIGDTPTDAEQEAFVTSFFDEFDDAGEFNPLWTTSIFYRLYAPSTSDHYEFSLLYGNQNQKPAFYEYQAIITEATGAGTGTLGSGESLSAGESVIAPSGVQLIYQFDGDLALLDGTSLLWRTFTTGANEVAMQSDGNLVVYNSVPAVAWSSGTSGNPGGYLVIQNDGELRLYNVSGQPILTLFSPWY